jgi:hypothetical protein
MADKINKSDLFGDLNLGAEIAALKELLGLVTKLQQETQKMAKNKLTDVAKIDASTVDGMKKLMAAKEDANKIEKQSNDLDKEAIKLKKQLTQAEDAEVKAKIRYQEASKAQKAALKDELILADQNAGTLQKLGAENRKLRREREGLNLETAKGKARLQEINKQLDLNNKRIISNSDALKKQRMNVGNYTSSVTEGIQASGLFSRQLMILQRIQATLAVFTKKSAQATEQQAVATATASSASGKFSKALRVLKVALISTGIGAIVVALGALIAGFASTQRGVDAFTKVLRPLKALFDVFIGFIQDTALGTFDKLKEALSNPKEAILALGTAIKENLLNRFKALGVFGEGLAKIFSGDLAEGFKDLGNAVIQGTTGVTEGIDKLASAGEAVGDLVGDALDKGAELDRLTKEFEKRQLESVIPLAEAKIAFQELKAIANDQLLTDEARIKALEDAEKQQRFIAKTEKDLLKLRIDAMELEQSFNDTSREDRLELKNLKVEALRFDEVAEKKIAGLISLKSGIQKRALMEEQKLKKAIHQADDKAEQNRIKFEREQLENELEARTELGMITIKEKKKLIDEIAKLNKELLDKEFEQQIQAIKDSTDAEEVKNKKIEEAQKEHERKIQRLNEQTADNKKKLDDEVTKQIIDNAQSVFAEQKQVFDKQLDERKELLNEELNDSKTQEDELKTLAKERVLFADESLAVEKAKQAEIQKELAKTEKRKQLLAVTESALQLLGSYAQGGSKTPFKDAFSDITKMLGAIQSIQFFADGTESVEGGIQGKDSVPAMLMPKERVVDVANNKKIGGMSNDQLADLAFKYRTGRLDQDLPSIKLEKQRFESNKELIDRVKDVEKAIRNIPEVSIDPHALANFITETIRRQNKVDRNHYKTNEIFK